MTAQIPLQLVQPIRYSSANFLVHGGVVGVITSLVTLSYQRVFSLAYVEGEVRGGKTHTGVYLVGHLQSKGRPARMVHADALSEWYASGYGGEPFQSGETIVIDDGDLFLEEVSQTARSGIFMDLVEQLGQVDGTLIILGATPSPSIKCSRQIRSRLDAGLHLVLGGPSEAELDSLLNLVTKQRGLQLSDAKRSFILRRVSRTLPALVECVERVEELGDSASPRTSFEALSDALGREVENLPLFERKSA